MYTPALNNQNRSLEAPRMENDWGNDNRNISPSPFSGPKSGEVSESIILPNTNYKANMLQPDQDNRFIIWYSSSAWKIWMKIIPMSGMLTQYLLYLVCCNLHRVWSWLQVQDMHIINKISGISRPIPTGASHSLPARRTVIKMSRWG